MARRTRVHRHGAQAGDLQAWRGTDHSWRSSPQMVAFSGADGHNYPMERGAPWHRQHANTRVVEVLIDDLDGGPQTCSDRAHAPFSGMDDVGSRRLCSCRVRGAVAVVGSAGHRALARLLRGWSRGGQVVAGARPSSERGCRSDPRPRRWPLHRWLPVTAHLGAGDPDDGGRAPSPRHPGAWNRRSTLHRGRHGAVPLLAHHLECVARVAPLISADRRTLAQ